jgi:phosphoglycerate dehydrogenase-like enzyme
MLRILRCSLDPAEAAAALRQRLPEHEIVLGPPDEIPSLVSDADVIVPARFPLDATLLRRAKRCRLVQQMGAGVDMVDLDAASSLGIPVANAPGHETGNADSVAEMALWQLIACRRRLPELTQAVRSGDWSAVPVTRALYGAVVCIVGYGAIGTRLRELLRPFGCRVLAVKRSAPEVPPADVELGAPADLPRFLAEADAVVLAVPLSDTTRGMVDAAFLARMPTGAVLVNVSRAEVIDRDALLSALRAGRLAMFGGDVFWTEPLDPQDPLMQLPAVLTPHVAGLTWHTIEGGARIVAENVRRLESGEPLLYRIR